MTLNYSLLRSRVCFCKEPILHFFSRTIVHLIESPIIVPSHRIRSRIVTPHSPRIPLNYQLKSKYCIYCFCQCNHTSPTTRATSWRNLRSNACTNIHACLQALQVLLFQRTHDLKGFKISFKVPMNVSPK